MVVLVFCFPLLGIKMKTNKLVLVADAVERISDITGTDDIPAIVDALIGVAWDEEEASEIKQYHSSDDEENGWDW
jgi:hypothetical protein